MKVIKSLLVLLFLSASVSGQRIGELAPEKQPEVFPSNNWGVDLMFGEGGFGLGTFWRTAISNDITGFVDISVSESKDEREIEYVDFWGNTFTLNKENRVFLIPLNAGIQYRLFSDVLTDNLRPYIMAGVGPAIAVSTPYSKEFFESFGDAKAHYGIGGYVGFGANFGTSKTNLVGINVRYYYEHLFGEGVENLKGKMRKQFGHFYISLYLGVMY